MKEVFDQIEVEVDQHAVDKKCDEIERKNLLFENENLIVECMSKDVFYTATNFVLTVSRFFDMHDAYTAAQKRIAKLEAENSIMKNKIQNDDHDKMIKHFSKLKVEHLNLQLKYQHLKERYGNKKSAKSSDAPAFALVFVIGQLEEWLQGRGNMNGELKEKTSRLTKKINEAHPILDYKDLDSQNKDLTVKVNALQDLNKRLKAENEKVKQHYKELYDSIKLTRAKTIKKTTSLLDEIKNLKAQLKGKTKCVTVPAEKPIVLALGIYPIDVEPIPPRNRNNKEVHLDYLKHLKESAATLREIVEEARVEKPLDTSLVYACRVKGATSASGSKPRSNTKKDRTLPAKSAMTKVEEHPKNNKSSVKRKNCVDSSISYKRSWKPIRRKFTLGEQCPLTRFTISKLVSVIQPDNVSTSAIVITERLSNTSHKPLTRYQRKNKEEKAISTNTPITAVTQSIDDSVKLTVCCSKHMTGDHSRFSNFIKKFIETVRFRNDHFGAIMGYGDYVIGDSVISRGTVLASCQISTLCVRKYCVSDLSSCAGSELTSLAEDIQCAGSKHHEVHEMHDDVQPNCVVVSNTEYTSDSNMIPYDHASLTAKLAIYKEQVKLYERRAKFELTVREQKIDKHLRIVITDQEVMSLKKNFKQKENKYLEEFLDMKALKEKVEDKIFKQDQSLQTVHMLCKPKPYYDEQRKVAIGYKSPLCLARTKQVQPALYNGHEIIKSQHVPAIIHNSEDTLEIAEITRKKMNEKMKTPLWTHNKINIRPPNYSKENFLATFTPQTQLTPKQIFWSRDILKMKTEALAEQAKVAKPVRALAVYPPNTPVKLVPKGIQKDLTKEIKAIFDELEDKVDQNGVNKKCDKIEQNNLLIKNDTLIANCLSKEVFYIATNSELNVSRFFKMHDSHTVVQARCLELETGLSKLKEKIQKDDQDAMVSNLENNREVHLEYLKHLKESVATIREIIKEARVERPLDSSLASAFLYTKRSQELVEYAVGTCPKDFNKRDKKQATTFLTRKKQVTFADQSGPQLLTPRTISSGLVPQPPSSTHNVPPIKNDWDMLFCLMFDEYFNPSPSVAQPVLVAAVQEPVVLTSTPSSTRIDQDTPSKSTSQTIKEAQSHVIPTSVEKDDHGIEVAHMDNNLALTALADVPSSFTAITKTTSTLPPPPPPLSNQQFIEIFGRRALTALADVPSSFTTTTKTTSTLPPPPPPLNNQ
uniref:Integrase, catalytic region, zinc finger, CCHC-type, peptidase aspartic, catalytic n=1 Tax=Tanacetum cinerariifolium TaxID=118510 RepID=A0A6L2KZE5_TANCI|nr:hypothetical protein [Tanacetum cinerariifolium]